LERQVAALFKKAEISVEGGGKIEVMFNPQEYNLNTGAKYSTVEIPGLDGPITQFISGMQDTLTIKLMFNTYKPPKYDSSKGQVVEVSENDMEAVTKYTSQIYNLTKIKGNLHRPPKCVFQWGSLQFTGVVTDVKQQFTMFLESGKPVRATVDVTFQSLLDPSTSKKMSPWESPDRTKYRILDESSSLWQLAYEEYGDPDYWKEIAKANHIRNPLDITSGMEVVLPPIRP
jgi:hypothetical protein